jgi:uncharacterized membrane protein
MFVGNEPTRPPTGGRVMPPVNAFVFNLLVGGCLGYFLLGQKQKGIAALIAFLILIPVTWCTGSMVLAMLAAVDGYMQAAHVRDGKAIGQWTFFNGHR